MQLKKEKILFREWVVCLSGCFFLFFLLYTSPSSTRLEKDVGRTAGISSKMIQISVFGAVAHPGVYEAYSGVSLKNILDMAVLLPSADKKSLYNRKILFDSCQIIVSEKKGKKGKKSGGLRSRADCPSVTGRFGPLTRILSMNMQTEKETKINSFGLLLAYARKSSTNKATGDF